MQELPPEWTVETVVALINQRHGLGLRLKETFKRGQFGAWLVCGPDGTEQVLKVRVDTDFRAQIAEMRRALQALSSRGYPVPRLFSSEYEPGLGTWYLQERLPGVDADLTPQVAEDLAVLTNKQVGLGGVLSPNAKNWTEHVNGVLFRDADGRLGRLRASSPQARALADDLQSFVRGYGPGRVRRNRDLVHGDFQHYNALQNQQGRVCGYVDWDGVGRGDRSLDLARLMVEEFNAANIDGKRTDMNVVRKLAERIYEESGAEGLTVFVAYNTLQLAEWAIREYPEDVVKFATWGHNVLDATRQLRTELSRRPQSLAG